MLRKTASARCGCRCGSGGLARSPCTSDLDSPSPSRGTSGTSWSGWNEPCEWSPPFVDGRYEDGHLVADRELVIARRHGAVPFEAIDAALHRTDIRGRPAITPRTMRHNQVAVPPGQSWAPRKPEWMLVCSAIDRLRLGPIRAQPSRPTR